MKNRIVSVLCIVLMIYVMSISAYAAEIPDMSKTGSVSVEMTYKGEAIPGGTLTAYRVADIKVENGADYSFEYTEAFKDCTVDISDLTKTDIAAGISEFVKAKDISGTTLEIDRKGKVVFEDLQLGLYLFAQEKAAEGYSSVSPFIVSVPAYRDGSYIYRLDATPKIATMPDPVETTAPVTETTVPEETTAPDQPPKLPQTGQTKWPVPVFSIAGMVFVVTGIYFVAAGRKKNYEN